MATNISPQDLKAMMDSGGTYALIDVREPAEFDKQQIFGSSTLPRRHLEYRIEQMVPAKNTALVLCDDTGRRARPSAVSLEGIGYSQVQNLEGGITSWSEAGFDTCKGAHVPGKVFGQKLRVKAQLPQITPMELHDKLVKEEVFTVLDSRTPEEFRSSTIPTARSLPGGELALRIMDLIEGDLDAPIAVFCAGSSRSIVGTHILRRLGLRNAYRIDGGTMGWQLAGLDLERGNEPEAMSPPSHSSMEASRAFAQRVATDDGVRHLSVQELQLHLEKSGAENVYLLDVRGAGEYEEGHIPGAVWAPGGQAVQRAEDWVAVKNGTVVLCCEGIVRSTLAASWFLQMGYSNACALEGGTVAWSAAGHALESGWPSQKPAGFEQATSRTRYITAQLLAERIDSDDAATVIDIESSTAYRTGHLPVALWAPRGWLEFRIGNLAPTPNQPVVLTCRDGVTSTLAAASLDRLGYTDVAVLEGGTEAWRGAGYSLASGMGSFSGEPDDVMAPISSWSREQLQEFLAREESLADWPE